jgi:hypothetical protein
MAAPTVVSATGSATSSAVNSLVVTLPVGRSSGQLMVMSFVSIGTPSTPSGWTATISNAAQGNHFVWTRVTDAAEGASVSVTWGGGGERAEACVLLIDSYTGTFDVAVTDVAQNITNPTPLPTGTTTVNDSLLIAALGTIYGSGMTWTEPGGAGWTEQYEHVNGATFGASLSVYTKTQATAGSVGGDNFVPAATHTSDKAKPTLLSVRPTGGGGGSTVNAAAAQTVTATNTATAQTSRVLSAAQTVTATQAAAAQTSRVLAAVQTVTATQTATASVTPAAGNVHSADAAQTITATHTATAVLARPLAAAQTVTATQLATATVWPGGVEPTSSHFQLADGTHAPVYLADGSGAVIRLADGSRAA